jgi:hypothetical protein
MDLSFIRRSVATAAWLAGLAFLLLLARGKIGWAWGLGLGSLWAIANWVLIAELLRTVLSPGRRLTGSAKVRLAVLGVIKFPVLYGLGYLFLRLGFPVVSYLVGFWILFAVVVAKAGGRILLGLDASPVARGVEGSGAP